MYLQPGINITALCCSWTLQIQQCPAGWNTAQKPCPAATDYHRVKGTCFPAIVQCPALDWVKSACPGMSEDETFVSIRVMKRDSSSELKWQTTLCLWERPGHAYFQVKRRLKLILHDLWSLKISAPFAKERVFPPHCLGRIPARSFHILLASLSLTLLPRCSSILALGARLLFTSELTEFTW